jgi:hypothetical protein
MSKTSETEVNRTFVIYDSRAIGGADHAYVMSVCSAADGSTLEDAKLEAPEYGHCVIYSYAGSPGETLTDERFEWADPALKPHVHVSDYPPNIEHALRKRGWASDALLPADAAFDEFCNWHGLTGWGPSLRGVLDDARSTANKATETAPELDLSDECVTNMSAVVSAMVDLFPDLADDKDGAP